jgi:hypothetical protein
MMVDVQVVAEEEQFFLSRQQHFLQQGLPPSSGAPGAGIPTGTCIPTRVADPYPDPNWIQIQEGTNDQQK